MRNRRATCQALVGSGHIIILVDKLVEWPFQRALAQHDPMVRELSSQGSNESLHERILPGTSIGCANFLDATAVEKGSHNVAVDAVIGAKEILRLQAQGHRFMQLLDDPNPCTDVV